MGQATSVRWRILALLVSSGFVAYLLRGNMSVAGKGLMADVGLSQIQFGMILAAFAWGYAIFQFPGGLFGDRIGARRALTLMLVAWGVLSILTGSVPSSSYVSVRVALAGMIGLRFLMGVAQAPFYPVTGGGTTCNWFPATGWALPSGLQNAGLTLGQAATGPIAAWLTVTLGWRFCFLLTAPAAFAVAAVWWWYARDSPAEHRGVNAEELALIDDGRLPTTRAPEKGMWKVLLRDRNIRILAVSYFCQNYIFYFFFNWLFFYLVDNRGFKVLEGGFYSAAPWLTGAVTAVLGGLTCDRLSKRVGIRRGPRRTAVAGLVAASVFLGAAGFVQSSALAVLLLSLCLGSQQFTDAAYWAATISVSGRHASAACGVLNTGGNVVGGVVALMVPLTVKAFGWGAALATASLVGLVGALLWVWIRSDEPLTI